MTFQEFQTCVRANFPGIAISPSGTIRLHPRPSTASSHQRTWFVWVQPGARIMMHGSPVVELYERFNLPYAMYLAPDLGESGDLVIGYESWLSDDGNLIDDGVPYYYNNALGQRITLYDEPLTILLRLVNLSEIFYYETVPQEN